MTASSGKPDTVWRLSTEPPADFQAMSILKHPEKGTSSPASAVNGDDFARGTSEDILASSGSQALHRKLRGKEVQLFAIGGAIGTCMFTSSADTARHFSRAGL